MLDAVFVRARELAGQTTARISLTP
jgi:hypothetical protein